MEGSLAVKRIKEQFKVVDVARISPPEGMEGSNWHQYLIKRGATEIVGQKPGSHDLVTNHARQVAEALNSRNSLSIGSPYAARRRA